MLATSELVTNAVVHACTPLLLSVELEAGHVMVSVLDGSAVPPTFGSCGPAGGDAAQLAESERGMSIVGQFGPWGVFRIPLGKTVWTTINAGPAARRPTRLPTPTAAATAPGGRATTR